MFKGLFFLLLVLFDYLPELALISVLVVLFLLIQDPERAVKLQAMILKPTYRLFRFFPRQYLAAKIGSSATEFFRRSLQSHVQSMRDFRLKVTWVRSPKDPILKQDGTVLLYIPEDDDQTQSIFNAAKQALPSVVCQTVRHKIDDSFCEAIDLAVLRKLADSMGPNARPVFRKLFLGDEFSENAELQRLFSDLVEIDRHGIFVSIFLNEMESLGLLLWNNDDADLITHHVRDFLDYLLQFPRRSVGQDIRLSYCTPFFKVAVILVAKQDRAVTEGETPYVNRLNRNLAAGIDSIYLYAFRGQADFLKKVRRTLRSDDRVIVGDVQKFPIHESDSAFPTSSAALVHVTRNSLFFDDKMDDIISSNKIVEGDLVTGRVESVAQTTSLVSVYGLLASLPRDLCSWQHIQHCEERLRVGQVRNFLVNSVDVSKGKLELSARLPEEDPWADIVLPEIGEVIEVTGKTIHGQMLISELDSGLEVLITANDLSWFPWECDASRYIGERVEVGLLSKDEESRRLYGNRKVAMDNPWPDLQESMSKGTIVQATVASVTDNTIIVRTGNGLEGFISAQTVTDSGMEFQDLRGLFTVGSSVEVQVDRVFVERRKIRFIPAQS